MKDEYIQTLHPMAGKSNKRILLKKYEVIKKNPCWRAFLPSADRCNA
ncbi:MAG TPA: hypothetical protein VIS49_09090 [Cyclobacteriaceae bacterium]